MAQLGLDAEQSYAQAARRVVAARTGELFAHLDGLLDIDRPERVHKMRVATRRLRAGLEVFAICFPRKQLAVVLDELKRLAAVLGERRDCDVQVALLSTLRANAGRSERQAIDLLLDELHAEQLGANRRLAAAVEHATAAKLERRLRKLAQ